MFSETVGAVTTRLSYVGLIVPGLILPTAFISTLIACRRTVGGKSWRQYFDFGFSPEIKLYRLDDAHVDVAG